MRFVGKSRLGFYPLPLSEAHRIRRFLLFPDSSSAIDPCVGDGVAFEAITSGAEVLRYGIELDAYRAEQARQRIAQVIHGNTMEVHCPVESFGLQFLNPPYDWTLQPFADGRGGRTEQVFLSHTYRWLKVSGVLVLVIPGDRLAIVAKSLPLIFVRFASTGWKRLSVHVTSRWCFLACGGTGASGNDCRTQISPVHDSNSPAWPETSPSFPPCPLNPMCSTACHQAGHPGRGDATYHVWLVRGGDAAAEGVAQAHASCLAVRSTWIVPGLSASGIAAAIFS